MDMDVHDLLRVSPSPRRLASSSSTYRGESWTSETSGNLREPNRLSALGYPHQNPLLFVTELGDGDSGHRSLTSS